VFATHPLVTEIARVLVRFDHVASRIINANHIGNQIDAAMILAWADFVNGD